MHGIVHIELPSPDLEKSKSFYSEVFGWEVTAWQESRDFMMWRAPDGPGGGFMKGDVAPVAGIMLYIEVEDIPAAMARIVENGGQAIKEKTEIGGGMGFFAVFADNVGNQLGLWSKD